jgi:hypothetical protein
VLPHGGAVNVRGAVTSLRDAGVGVSPPLTVTVSVSGSPEELETGMQLAYLLMTDPVVEKAALEQWKQQQKQSASMRKMVPEGILSDLASETIFPKSEIRVKSLEVTEIERATPEAAQAWLRTILATGPIEVSVVGDIDQARAMELVQRYVGSLPKRPRTCPIRILTPSNPCQVWRRSHWPCKREMSKSSISYCSPERSPTRRIPASAPRFITPSEGTTAFKTLRAPLSNCSSAKARIPTSRTRIGQPR